MPPAGNFTLEQLRECIKLCEDENLTHWTAHDMRMLREAARKYSNHELAGTGSLMFETSFTSCGGFNK